MSCDMLSVLMMHVVLGAATFADCVLKMMMAYLTSVWKLKLTHAAAVMNVFMGGRDVLLIVMVFLVDAYLGHHNIFLISSIINCIGMMLLTISAESILSEAESTTQKKCLYFTALPVLAIGYAGLAASYQRLWEAHFPCTLCPCTLRAMWQNLKEGMKSICNCCKLINTCQLLQGGVAIIIISYVGGFAIQFTKNWAIRFGVTTILFIVATFMYFIIGKLCFISSNEDTPRGSPLTTFFRVLAASYSKRSRALPNNPADLYQENDHEGTLRHTDNLRRLDKAAIIIPNSISLEEQKREWKLCSVTEVEEAKIIVYLIPLWVTFSICGVVTNLGGTFFVEQANRMDQHLGILPVPLFTLILFYECAKILASLIYCTVRNVLNKNQSKYMPPIGMAVAMLSSIVCCITAAEVERRRRRSLAESKEMSMFWLVPQYLFLGGLDGLARDSCTNFFNDHAPKSLRNYLMNITLGVTGAGIMLSGVIVYAVSRVKPSWFQKTLNESRLDNYYWFLAVLSSINLAVYTLVALLFPFKDSRKDNDQPGEEQQQGNPTCLSWFIF